MTTSPAVLWEVFVVCRLHGMSGDCLRISPDLCGCRRSQACGGSDREWSFLRSASPSPVRGPVIPGSTTGDHCTASSCSSLPRATGSWCRTSSSTGGVRWWAAHRHCGAESSVTSAGGHGGLSLGIAAGDAPWRPHILVVHFAHVCACRASASPPSTVSTTPSHAVPGPAQRSS